MQVKQCRICGKLFQSLGNYVCPECSDLMDQQFRKVRDYLYTHPDSDIAEIAKETGVSERNILQFIKEERISLMSLPAESEIRCERCGKPISTGRLCPDCKDKLSKMFQNAVESKNSGGEGSSGGNGQAGQGRRRFEDNGRF